MTRHLILLMTLLSPILAPAVRAWGMRGHDTICQAATFLVKDSELQDFMKSRGTVLGHLCHLPDSAWRNMSAQAKAVGDSTHYLNPEPTGRTLNQLPLDFKEFKKLAPHKNLGSLWWRADQFFRLAVDSARRAAQVPAPTNPLQQGVDELPYNQAIFSWIQNLGLMGHFVADAAMPYHNTVDYDGQASGQGGIHSLYESFCVAQMDEHLLPQLVKEGRELKPRVEKFLAAQKSPLERMKALSGRAFDQIPLVAKADVRGQSGHKDLCKKWIPLARTQMAWAARTLALLWDEAYQAGGRPPLKLYKSYRFPFKPEFVAPDY